MSDEFQDSAEVSSESEAAEGVVLNPHFAPNKVAPVVRKKHAGGRPKGTGRPMTVDEEDEVFDCFTTDWNITRKYVVESAYLNGLERATELNLVPSIQYWREGSDAEHKVDVIGGRSEVLSMRELWLLYSFTCKGLKVLGIEISFEEWLNLRDRARKDLYWLSETVLNVPLVEDVHRQIINEVYPHLNADGMFTLDYQLTDVHKAIAAQSDIKEFCIVDFRGALKTAEASCFVLQFYLNFPDARVFNVSSTDDLAIQSLRIMKGYLGREAGSDITAFLQLFPEYTLRGKDSYTEQPFILPCRRFKQKGFSYETYGVLSAASGRHCDLYVGDDLTQEEGTEVTRATLKKAADSQLSNIPDPHALKLILATRYHKEDWISHRIALYEEDPTSMRYFCGAVLTAKAGFEDLPVQELLEDIEKVDLRWANRYGTPEKTLAEYRRKARRNLSDFLHQQMNSPVSSDVDDDKLSFDMDKFPTLFIDPQTFPEGEKYMVVDIAWSNDLARADYSCIGIGRVGKSLSSTEEMSLYVEEIDAQRRRSSELALNVVEHSIRFPCKMIIVERIGGSEAVIDEIRRLAAQRGHILPQIWPAPVIITTNAKFKRIKTLDIAVSQSRLWFSKAISPVQTTLTIDQFGRYKGKRSGTKRDDIPDAIALLWHYVVPVKDPNKKEDAARTKELEELEAREARRKQYEMIFGQSQGGIVTTGHQLINHHNYKGGNETPAEEELGGQSGQDVSPIHKALGRGGFVRDPNKKPLGFGYMLKRPLPGKE